MPKINVLDKHVAELIAAGEVVERPAAIVKELLENAIDAGATAVTVEIKNGGISFIRITDNGSGIEKDDIKNAFLRHATSKIKLDTDLDSISTLGFRGEALASVSAVARVELLTKTQNEEIGSRYIIEGGEQKEFAEAGCPNGTTFVIRDIFFNTPARMKFLKKDSSEGTACAAVVERIALSHPEVSIKFIKDFKEELLTPGDNNLKSAIYAVCGKDFAQGLIPLEYEMNGIKISGYISSPEHARASRAMQFFYINGRYVRTRTAMAALEEAFKGSIMTGKFPSCVMNILLNTETVDVNVHPAKIEVRFVNERPVFESVYYAVKNALSNGKSVLNVTPKAINPSVFAPAVPYKPQQTTMNSQSKMNVLPQDEGLSGTQNTAPVPNTVTVRDTVTFIEKETVAEAPLPNIVKIEEEPPAQSEEFFIPDKKPEENTAVNELMPKNEPEPEELKEEIIFKLVGEAFDTYIIIEHENNLLYIDKHAAHERIIYNRLKKEKQISSQMLLLPVNVTLSRPEYLVLDENAELLEGAGFEVENFGTNTMIVRAVPGYIDAADAHNALVEIAGLLLNHKQDITTQKQDFIFHSVACRSAIKAGHKSTREELSALVKQVLGDKEVRHCPHGRPVMFAMKKSEIERHFGRI